MTFLKPRFGHNAFAFGIGILLPLCCSALYGQPANGPSNKPFTDWITSAGFDVGPHSPAGVVILREELKPQSYSLEISVGNINLAIGESNTRQLYRSFLQKATVLVELPPDRIEVVLREVRGSYRSGTEIDTRLKWVDGQIVITEEATRNESAPNPPYGFSQNFEGVRRKADFVYELSSRTTFQSSLETRSSSAPTKIRAYLESLYQKKGATVSVTSANDHLLILEVRGMRGEIFTHGAYWERLKVILEHVS